MKHGTTYAFIFRILTAGIALLMFGCAHLYDDLDNNESDIPWNTPQQWEGTPAIPGIGQGMQ